jgi:hypothetical protein
MSHRFLPLVLILGVAAGLVAGYALAGLADSPPLVIAVTVTAQLTTPTTTVTVTVTPTSLPRCSDPTVPVGALCLPIFLTPPECDANAIWYNAQDAEPCRKRKTYP